VIWDAVKEDEPWVSTAIGNSRIDDTGQPKFRQGGIEAGVIPGDDFLGAGVIDEFCCGDVRDVVWLETAEGPVLDGRLAA
jgi:hypothetical protein